MIVVVKEYYKAGYGIDCTIPTLRCSTRLCQIQCYLFLKPKYASGIAGVAVVSGLCRCYC